MKEGTLEITAQVVEQDLLVGAQLEQSEQAEIINLDEYRRRKFGGKTIEIAVEELGYNDPLTYLFNYLKKGEESLSVDLETDVAERLKQVGHFQKQVLFNRVGDDFVSVNDSVSLRNITQISLDKVQYLSSRKDERKRAEFELKEVDLLSEWFDGATPNSFFIVESLPLTEDEDFAMIRIYQKVGNQLEGCYVSLKNPNIDLINNLHANLGIDHGDHKDSLDILTHPFEIKNTEFTGTKDVISHYVSAYDQLLSEKNGKDYSFGFEVSKGATNLNAVEIVKSHPRLLAGFKRVVQMLAQSCSEVTTEIAMICHDLEIKNVFEGQRITTKQAREILKRTMTGVVGSLIHLNSDVLNKLESSDCSSDAGYGAIVCSSNNAQSRGESYDGVCPSISASEGQTSGDGAGGGGKSYEERVLLLAYNVYERLKNFGKPKIDICVVPDCPSHGNPEKTETKKNPNKTLVGGCGVCVHCHKMFQEGKDPVELLGKKEKERLEKKQKEEAAERLRLAMIQNGYSKNEGDNVNVSLVKLQEKTEDNDKFGEKLKRLLN